MEEYLIISEAKENLDIQRKKQGLIKDFHCIINQTLKELIFMLKAHIAESVVTGEVRSD
ncbi:hypothetical protein L9W92_10475 [Pelotomaculum terephthalicicum JT]|uniref:hypothetical protein n=1 Tax=Pelotomaculum TaxID=191373 RepID=UPI0009C8533F|nr:MULTISPECIES: hypothetical protein [Pelotomaculum]MCG9968476.1 hypothetical protein [Pelotomaculum terephthalicicum JT]OPX88900.1 MAG: hypothetical protein A4E54_01162 [Pelotomaculum sp. PtaB.Bin117]OPY60268.1 MAG: hypothetical protein A4E56_02792 [Pelotomaculum sp. PtaU1.Bin065]